MQKNVDRTLNKKRPIENTRSKYLLLETQREDKDRCDRGTEVEYDFGNVMTSSLQS